MIEQLEENEDEKEEDTKSIKKSIKQEVGILKKVTYATPHKQRNLLFDRWSGLTEDESLRMNHDYDYEKHLRPMGKGFFQPSTEFKDELNIYKNQPKQVDESDLDIKYGGKTLPSFDVARLTKDAFIYSFNI